MKDNIKKSRRKLLKTLAAGGGVITTVKLLPETWVKPVVESVVLPAHAGISGDGGGGGDGLTGNFLTTEEIEASSEAGPVMLAIAVCSEIVNNVASVTGIVGSVPVNETGIAVPGSTEIPSSGVTATIELKSVSGTEPNRQLTVGVQLTGDLSFGPQDFTSPETLNCPA